jgi:regulator of sigma E protease
MVRFPKTAASEQRAAIGHVQPDSPAAQAGIKEGDVIAQFNGKDNPSWEDIMLAEVAGAGQTMTGLVERNGQRVPFAVTPKLDEKHGIGLAGWSGQSEIIISGVVTGGEAEKQGLKPGDLFVSINSQPIRTVQRIHDIIKKSEGKTVDIAYEREGQLRNLQLNPRWSEDDKRWLIGVQLAQRITYVQLGFGEAFVQSVQTNAKGTTLLLRLLQGIVERRMSPKSLEGPIRIAQISGDAAREGAYSFVSLMATVSLNLAVFNLLPIPILDGGIILLLLIEMLMRRDLSLPVKETVFKLGFVFLMMVVVFVLYNDITKIFPG